MPLDIVKPFLDILNEGYGVNIARERPQTPGPVTRKPRYALAVSHAQTRDGLEIDGACPRVLPAEMSDAHRRLREIFATISTQSTIACRMDNRASTTSLGSNRLRGWLIFLGFTAIIAYLFVNGHTVHVLSALPFLIILACPVMMFFMMKGMNHGGQDSGTTTKR